MRKISEELRKLAKRAERQERRRVNRMRRARVLNKCHCVFVIEIDWDALARLEPLYTLYPRIWYEGVPFFKTNAPALQDILKEAADGMIGTGWTEHGP